MEQLILLFINTLFRTTDLQLDNDLSDLAQERAELLCDTNQFLHIGLDPVFDTSPITTHAGENLAKYFGDDTLKMLLAWKNSPSHLANFEEEDYRLLGVGHDDSCDTTVLFFADKYSRI